MRYVRYKNMRKDSVTTTKPGESSVKAFLPYIAVALTLISALLYLYGRIHYGAYLSAWGLPEGLFPLAKEDSIISGFFRVVIYSIKSASNAVLSMVVLISCLFTVFISCYKPVANFLTGASFRLRDKFVPVLKRNVAITPTHDKLVAAIGRITLIIGSFILVPVLLFLPCIWIGKEAKNNANQERAKLISGFVEKDAFPLQPRTILYVKNEAKGFDQYSGHLINTSATHCALYNTTKGVGIFPLTSVSRMVIHEVKTSK